ncbi:hypothetical protein [Roseomonas sp. BN140053]|uniref:hypothetical protein n=1 Tax=Roseomonas sp. BN140053 TaxID=3391898 RepID=UPI0039EAB2B4
MQTHKFLVGDNVSFVPSRSETHIPGGTYTITRQLPNDAPDREYRVKNLRDGHERVMQESQLLQDANPAQRPR